MNIRITNCDSRCMSCIFRADSDGDSAVFEAHDRAVSLSPDKRYAVVRYRSYLYIAVRVASLDEELLTGEFVDSYYYSPDDDFVLAMPEIAWNWIHYGFCKLILWAPESVNEFGGFFDGTLCRFYFDRELYERKKKEQKEKSN